MSRALKRMLINASHSEEVRVAIINGQKLDDLDVEYPSKEQKKSNIYLAVISRIEPSLEAVFVNYGGNRHGFLPLKEIESSYFLASTNDPKADIKKILKEGQELLIQVDKEERGNKGAALTTYISLAGCYLVLMPNNPKAGGISRRIEGDDRSEMKDTLNSLTIPDSMGVIIRTAGLGKNHKDLQWDLDILLHHWNAIKSAAGTRQAPCLLHQESNIIIRTIRDNLKPDIKEILIDDKQVYEQAKQYMELLRADSKNIVKLYENQVPLFTKFQIESQIEEAFHHEIRLPSGGSIVVDRAEALTAIDINSAQSTKGQDIENTALNTNLEAAAEIARQLRLRDVGGLIVIDFIDMGMLKNQREVENKLREELQIDRAKIQIGRISKFGLLEMSRQRLKSSLGENTQVICSKCSGKGSLRTVESLSLSLLRIIEEQALKPNTGEVQAQLPIELCTYLANEKRETITQLEQSYNIRIILIPNPHYVFPNYSISSIRADKVNKETPHKSYTIIEEPPAQEYISNRKQQTNEKDAAVVQQMHTKDASLIQSSKPNLLKRLWSSLFDSSNSSTGTSTQKSKLDTERRSARSDRSDRRNQRSERSERTDRSERSDRNDQSKSTRQNRSDRSDRSRNRSRNKNRKHDNIGNTRTEQKFQVDDTAAELFYSAPKSKNPELKQTQGSEQKNRVTIENRKDKNESAEIQRGITNKNNQPVNISSINSQVEISTEKEPVAIEQQAEIRKPSYRTKILPGENLTRKKFYPKKRLPYKFNKYSDNLKDSSNKDLEIQTNSNEQDDYNHQTNQFIVEDYAGAHPTHTYHEPEAREDSK